MAKWQHAPPPPPTEFHRSCTISASSVRQRSGSLNDKLIAPSPASLLDEHEREEQDDESRSMQLAAMAIPQFRSCRSTNNSSNTSHNGVSQHQMSTEWRIRRRGRSVSDNSSSSTSSLSSNASSSAGRFSIQQLSASVSALRSGSMDSDDSMDGSTLATVGSIVVAPQLPQPPYPVDPYHFYCKPEQSTGSVLSEITTLLNDCDVEYSLHAFKCKFKCVKYMHYSHVEFIVRVYTTHQNALLIEFQRRSGSVLLWDGLYNILYHKLIELIDTTAAACPQSGGQKRVGAIRQDSLSAQIWRTMSSQTPSSGVEAMKIMLTSKYVDAQREGCSGLAALTEDAQSAYLVAKYDLVEHLVVAAESNDLDMARCAVGALINISKAMDTFSNQEIADRTLEQIKRAAKIVIELLGKTTDQLFSLELLRECARALRSFGKICPQQVVACEGDMQLLHHVNHRDMQLAHHCREALQELQMNG
ncbi:hypothetical protein FI667_g3437, partial [Globisporangium splendens]